MKLVVVIKISKLVIQRIFNRIYGHDNYLFQEHSKSVDTESSLGLSIGEILFVETFEAFIFSSLALIISSFFIRSSFNKSQSSKQIQHTS